MNEIQLQDCEKIGRMGCIDWGQLRNTTILITGSTGLIGSNLVNAIAYNNWKKGLCCNLILPVRDVKVAKVKFDWTNAKIIQYEIGEKLDINERVDYIVHLASPTDSKGFAKNPVETMTTNIEGYRGLLEWAVKHPVRKFIGLSTMEVYGFPEKGHKVTENELGSFETMNTRNSYPIAKIACEALCNSYFKEYGVPAVILRATQTFGPGVKYFDGRIFAQLMRCVIEKRNIVLKSEGLTERSYLYTADAVSAILVSLLKADPGQAYSIANSESYISIRDMAKMVADVLANGEIDVIYDISENNEKLGYADTLFMDLDTKKIEKLGWKATTSLEMMFERMISAQIIDSAED